MHLHNQISIYYQISTYYEILFKSPLFNPIQSVGHPNVKGFWSHGGNLGTIETVYCGKPAIITPFYGDQYMNAAALVRRGMGFKQNLLEITADSIYNTVQKLLDPKYVTLYQMFDINDKHC